MYRYLISLIAILAFLNSVCAQVVPVKSPDKGTPMPKAKMHVVQSITHSITFHAAASESVHLSLDGIVLTSDSGNLKHDVDFVIASLAENQDSPLQSDMVNMTKGAMTYRMLPMVNIFLPLLCLNWHMNHLYFLMAFDKKIFIPIITMKNYHNGFSWSVFLWIHFVMLLYHIQRILLILSMLLYARLICRK